MKAAVVVADFYPDIAQGLLESCESVLAAESVTWRVRRVGGALEIPLALQQMAGDGVDFLVALGCVIRGDTYHFEVVANTGAYGIMRVQLTTGVPVGNGVLTVENKGQALARLDKGGAAARAALDGTPERRR